MIGTDHVGTAALGCPAEQGSAVCGTGKGCRAALGRTAEGGCPTWFGTPEGERRAASPVQSQNPLHFSHR